MATRRMFGWVHLETGMKPILGFRKITRGKHKGCFRVQVREISIPNGEDWRFVLKSVIAKPSQIRWNDGATADAMETVKAVSDAQAMAAVNKVAAAIAERR